MSNPPQADAGTLIPVEGIVGITGFRAYQIFPAMVNVADPAGMTDLKVAQLSIDATGRLRVQASQGIPVSPFIQADCLAAAATTAGPGAGGALATIATPPAGYYQITATVYFTVVGTVNNAEFREGAAVVSRLQLPAVVSQIPLVHTFFRALDGATNISINATAADAGGTYSAMLIATRQG